MGEWSYRTCRFCGEIVFDDHSVKYEVRHYAHFKCYLDAGKPLSALHEWQRAQFPYRLLKERGLLDQVAGPRITKASS